MILGTIFYDFSHQGCDQKFNDICVVFCCSWPPSWHSAGPGKRWNLCLMRPSRASWRGCFDFLSLLASFWKHFGSTWSWILSLFRLILGSISLFLWHCFSDVCLHSVLYLLRSTTTPKANISWPGGLRGAIKLQ